MPKGIYPKNRIPRGPRGPYKVKIKSETQIKYEFYSTVRIGTLAECWVWEGYVNQDGYGRVRYRGRLQLAHRIAWQMEGWAIGTGMRILHTCDNPRCVNLTHLFEGTQADNITDMLSKRRGYQQKKKCCPRGHPYDANNTRFYRGGRVCRACDRDRCKRRDEERRNERGQTGADP